MTRRLRGPALAAVVLLAGCSVGQVVSVVSDPATAIPRLLGQKAAAYAVDPTRAVRDLESLRSIMRDLVARLRGEATEEWGAEEGARVPETRRYVKYTGGYRSRAIVDFDRGEVTVETVDTRAPDERLIEAVTVTLLTPDDPRAVDLYSDRAVEIGGRPFLEGLVVDRRGRPIVTEPAARTFAREVVGAGVRERDTPDGRRVHFVTVPMVEQLHTAKAARYRVLVDASAGEFGVSENLVYAVIDTESSFNPFAVSRAPAFGLMQIVPTTAGVDAERRVRGREHVPTRDELFDPANNIRLGTAYLDILDSRYLKGITDPVSREYCVIAAYNGGAGTVLRTFDRDRARALRRINALTPAEVYRRLTEVLPRAETRRYLKKVLAARRRFAGRV